MSTSTLRASLMSILLATVELPAALQAQSLADVAKKAAERRAHAEQADKSKDPAANDAHQADGSTRTKTYTNKDLGSVASEPTIPVESKTGPSSSVATSTASTSGGKDEAYWRNRMNTLRATCQAKSAAVKSLQNIEMKRIADARKEMAANCKSCSQNAEISVTLPAVVQVEVEKAKADLTACNSTTATTEEEARVTGVPPGWLREK